MFSVPVNLSDIIYNILIHTVHRLSHFIQYKYPIFRDGHGFRPMWMVSLTSLSMQSIACVVTRNFKHFRILETTCEFANLRSDPHVFSRVDLDIGICINFPIVRARSCQSYNSRWFMPTLVTTPHRRFQLLVLAITPRAVSLTNVRSRVRTQNVHQRQDPLLKA